LTVNAYPIVTDLHRRNKNFDGRVNYLEEMEHAFEQVVKINRSCYEYADQVFPIFAGDIWDRSYNDLFMAISENNKMIQLRNEVTGIYVTLGNHELTYYKDNPFWTLIREVKSSKIMKSLSHKIWQPRGRMNVFELVDELEDGNVRFLFNHYGCPITRPRLDGKTNIGVFHMDLYAKAILEDSEREMGIKIFEHTPVYFDNTQALQGYHYAFLAHMHMLYGQYKYTDESTGFSTWLHYLSTLGRTNHLEINNARLERNIPVVVVEDGELKEIKHNKFDLLPREACVNEEIIEMKQSKRMEAKETKYFVGEYVPVVDDPIENLRISLTAHPAYLDLFEELLDKGFTTYERELSKLLEEVRWKR
jgi:hypothetical protein